jgi:hypothetical protein
MSVYVLWWQEVEAVVSSPVAPIVARPQEPRPATQRVNTHSTKHTLQALPVILDFPLMTRTRPLVSVEL